MQREPAKWRPHKAQSTDARHRGGLVRSSDEGAVMALERRGEPVLSADRDQPRSGVSQGQTIKSFNISKCAVWGAWKRVKSNGGAAGIDDQSLIDFEADLSGHLYKLWNRMSSGSYVPPAVKRVDIPKADGGTRPLGIPTVADRVALRRASYACIRTRRIWCIARTATAIRAAGRPRSSTFRAHLS